MEKIDTSEYQLFTEGQATILFPKGNAVFYNPAMETNRDLSIAVAQVFVDVLKEEDESHKKKRITVNEDLPSNGDPRKGIKILEALSATGLRAIRYSKEVPGVHSIIANDIEAAAIETIKRNVNYNGIPTSLIADSEFPPIIPNHQDAQYKLSILQLLILNVKHNY